MALPIHSLSLLIIYKLSPISSKRKLLIYLRFMKRWRHFGLS